MLRYLRNANFELIFSNYSLYFVCFAGKILTSINMPNKCGERNCSENYKKNKCSVFKLPKDEIERQAWLNFLPVQNSFSKINPAALFICERHWPRNSPHVKLPGGCTRPALPPNVFNLPQSCLPTPKPAPRKPKQVDVQLKYFMERATILSFNDFHPEKELMKKYDNVLTCRQKDKIAFIFMTQDFFGD